MTAQDSNRDLVYSRIDAALAPLRQEASEGKRILAEYPDYDENLSVTHNLPDLGEGPDALWKIFAHKVAAVNGQAMESPSEVIKFFSDNGCKLGYCDAALLEIFQAAATEAKADVTFETDFKMDDPDRYDFGITRASGAIAETGSIIFSDEASSSRLAALAPWVHVAALKKEDILADCPTAIREKLGTDPNVIWATGPSKTADVEGILIEGVHGPGVQICCLVD